MSTPRALVIEDSSEFAALAAALLQAEGFEVSVAGTGERGIELARSLQPELLLVDLVLPGLDGFEVCRRLRSFTDAYIVLVTGRDEDVDKVVGLRLGADDYVTKPWSSAELAARIGALRLRRQDRRRPQHRIGRCRIQHQRADMPFDEPGIDTPTHDIRMRRRPRQITRRDDVRRFGPLVVDPGAHEVVLDGRQVSLTRIEFELLELLSSAPRRVFSRGQLLESVWGYSSGDDHVVDVHVANLRRKIGECASEQRFIRTVRGVGYRFESAVPASVPA